MYLHGAGHQPAFKMQYTFMYDVMIWSSQKLIQEGWTAFLSTQDRLKLVGGDSPRHDVLTLIRKLRPNVILLDIDLPWPDVSAAFSLITSIPRHTAMICVASHVTSVWLTQMKGLGVKACVSKYSSLNQLLTVVYQVCHGLTWYAPPEDTALS
jgi:DNA-binding NarL/FixJ family response regulator